MWTLKLVPAETKIDFIRLHIASFIVSASLVIASLGLFFTQGLNFGIDFKGGTLIEIGTNGPADIADLRDIIGSLDLGEVQIQEFGSPEDVLIRVGEKADATDNAENLSAVDQIRNALPQDVTFRRVEVVGPQISGELVRAGFLAVTVAIGLMLFYIWLRFEWQFSVGAVLALIHDIILTIGVFCLIQLEFNLSIIAAILTIVGYSMNDTVVVYDRVRENLRRFKKMPLSELANLSINSTLSRTVMTSVTTLLALFSLYILGGEVIRGFTLAMIWGVFVGTYSSIFIAAPVLMYLGVKRDWSEAAKDQI
ncbi:Plasmid partition ParA protein [Candidatus Micropelagos thuwalensis]|jgi:preprotein translocase SecF subunit|uniref:Protein-export membrane protein SecF n=1 Tax=Candidatus Micropelagius thuwalensis TaxID=1397666 RepID=U2WV85_9PROT|nr:protein translocase subunit SecF [Candidatus Micropelagos thuwalensis]ERL47460.1 Plasmid partition ParA protein [Candidatus Micropelagos thuwalensis]MEC7176698.1 protein translocase subunit SecF [Pseudomonadota bacterium]